MLRANHITVLERVAQRGRTQSRRDVGLRVTLIRKLELLVDAADVGLLLLSKLVDHL